MVLNIAPLSKAELKLLLSILRVANPDEKTSAEELLKAEKSARNYIRNPRGRVRLVSRHIWGDPTNIKDTALRELWAQACSLCINWVIQVRSEGGGYFPFPMVLLPSRDQRVAINSREQFVEWMFARAIANGQWLRFVKCELCGKIALRDRARSENRYCTTVHQKVANLEQMMWKKHPEEFRAWLHKQPDEKAPRLKKILLAALENGWQPKHSKK
jgi:hypothetical protein